MTSIIRFYRTIRRSGRSTMVAIPPEIMKSLGWGVGEKVIISVTEERAVLIERSSQDPKLNLD